MLATLTAAGLVKLVAALLGAGIASGFLAGIFGIGGGAILVPVLYEVFGAIGVAADIRMQLSVGTSMAIIIPTTIRTFTAHRARGTVDMTVVRAMAIPSVAGVALGVLTSGYLGGGGARLIWAICGALMSLRMLIGTRGWQLGDTLPAPSIMAAYGLLVGFISAMMSIAGGFFVTLYLTLYGRPIHQAIATGTGVGPFISIAGVIGYIVAGWGVSGTPLGSLGYVNVLGAALVAVTSTLAAPLGIKAAYGMKPRYLEIAFGLFMGSAALRFAISLL